MSLIASRKEFEQFWHFGDEKKEDLTSRFAKELPVLRAKVGVSQESISVAIGISRQTYNTYENLVRPIPWTTFIALLFYFDYMPGTHSLIRKLDLFPTEFDECWIAGKMLETEDKL